MIINACKSEFFKAISISRFRELKTDSLCSYNTKSVNGNLLNNEQQTWRKLCVIDVNQKTMQFSKDTLSISRKMTGLFKQMTPLMIG